MARPDVSYFILNWNPNASEFVQPRYEKCLEYLYRNGSPGIKKEVIVFDQGNPPSVVARTEELRKQYGFKHILLGENVGISAGINLGFQMARGHSIALMTYDVLMTKGCDETCLNQVGNFNLHVTPLSDQSDCRAQVHRPSEPFGSDIVSGLTPKTVRPVPLVELSLNYFSRECLASVGYFDERWKACFENMDYCLRIMLAGGQTVVAKDAFAWHYHNTSSQYIGKLPAYAGYIGGDPFADGRLAKFWPDKWGTRFDFIDWAGGSMPEPARWQTIMHDQSLKDKIYLGWPQERGY